jgi:hypothetical protein
MPPIVASDRRHHALSRRDFVAGLGKAAAVGIVAPFTFVRRAAARTDALRRFLVQKLAEANTPGIAVAVVRQTRSCGLRVSAGRTRSMGSG